jgi:hypothetical protein
VTATSAGYSEIFQEGEAYRGLQVTDRQHPHDLFMQLAAAWRIPLATKTQITFAGGPVGQPTLGPVPFMHRPSASENPVAPLSHHIFDSTHTSSSVAMVRVDRPRLAFEGSLFHGREKDEHRYGLELGALDSWAVRGWFRPSPEWTVQASHGFLHEPEALEPGNQRRTNASVSWFRPRGSQYTAMLVAIGRNARQYSAVNSVLVEGTHGIGRWRTFGRFESTSVETEILLLPLIVHRPHPGELVDTIRATTLGAVRDIAKVQALAVGVGADVTLYSVPSPLKITHGANPVSFRIFVRLTRADWRLRMWNETMGGHDGAGHVHH